MGKVLNFESDFSSKAEKARDIIWDALDTKDPVERLALVQKALELDPGCTDAYNLLGDAEQDREKRLGYYRQAIENFKKQHDQQFFDEITGFFWGEMETRPYMRALLGYGQSLWETNKPKEAVETYHTMLTLNPLDNQGVRYILVSWLFIVGDLKGIRKLLKTYKEGTASMLFSTLLLNILEKKDKKLIQKHYDAAVEANGCIVPYLLKKKKIPAAIPGSYTFGSKEEAVIYAAIEYGAAAWQAHPEALTVLAELVKAGK
jgi:tetratricopeptide (TPR) repeat protein